jgi:hypothetical protein
MIRYDQKVRGIVNRLCGLCYMDYDSPGKEAEPNPVLLCKWNLVSPYCFPGNRDRLSVRKAQYRAGKGKTEKANAVV